MKAADIRDMSPEEQIQQVADLKEELFNLRFQNEVGQLENPQRLKRLSAHFREAHRGSPVMNLEHLGNEQRRPIAPI